LVITGTEEIHLNPILDLVILEPPTRQPFLIVKFKLQDLELLPPLVVLKQHLLFPSLVEDKEDLRVIQTIQLFLKKVTEIMVAPFGEVFLESIDVSEHKSYTS
jgi:hypothetical protein